MAGGKRNMDLIACTANKTNAEIWDFSPLKVVCNENKGGSGRRHTFSIGLGSWRSMFFSLSILLSSLISMYFRFRYKLNFLQRPHDRQNAVNCSPSINFFCFLCNGGR
jgi:hypothetical protein